MNNIVAIYCRISKEDDNLKENQASESIQNQKSILAKYCIEKSWDIYKIYCDEDFSGSDNNRPEWNLMLRDAQNHKFNIILCKTQSRFSRNMDIIEKYIHNLFLEWEIRFVSIVDNADTSIKGNKKARQINSLINEWYLEDLSENIKAVLKNKMSEGELLSAFAPYGYKKSSTDRHRLIIDDSVCDNVKQIFQWNSEGYGAAKISRMLNDLKIPNPRKHQEITGIRHTFKYEQDEIGIWSANSVSKILHNRAYCGDTVQHKTEQLSYKTSKRKKISENDWIIVENTHEPIIDREIWNTIVGKYGEKYKPCKTGKVHILAGKIFCFYCGKAMQKNHGTSVNCKDIAYLRCRDKYSYSKKCPTPNIRLDTVLDVIKDKLSTEFDIDYINKVYNLDKNLFDSDNTKMVDTFQRQLKNHKVEIEKNKSIVRNLYLDKINSIITDEQFVNFNTEFSANVNKLEMQINELEIKIKEMQNTNSVTINFEDSLKEYIESKKFDRKIIEGLIKKIIYGQIDETTEETKIEIFWNL